MTGPQTTRRARKADRIAAAPILVIGGLDPSGGAGLARDLVVATALGRLARPVVTALTDQDAAGVRAVRPRRPAEVAAEVRRCLETRPAPVAVKVGMVGTAAMARALARALRAFDGPIIVDPVLGASSGGRLYAGPLAALDDLCALATLVTPNAVELATLTGRVIPGPAAAAAAAAELRRRSGARAVLAKGGHLPGRMVTDTLVGAADELKTFAAPRLPGRSPRGTGCALATALAVATGERKSHLDWPDLVAATGQARAHVHGLIARAVPVGRERFLPPR